MDVRTRDELLRARRRRHWVALGAALAVTAAVTAPLFFLGGDSRTAPAPPGAGSSARAASAPTAAVPAEPTAPSDPAPSAPTPAGTGPYDLHDVVAGAPPAVPFLERDRLVRPDGSTVDLPRVYEQFVPFGDGLVGVYNDRLGDRFVDFVDAEGRRTDSAPVAADVVANAQGDLLAWASPEGVLELAWPDGRLSLGNQGGPVTTAALLGESPCVEGEPDCRVFVNTVDGRPPSVTAPDGSVEPVAPGALHVQDAHPSGLVTVQLSADLEGPGSCSGVYDRDAGRLLWRTCDHWLLRFSPDATYVLATDPYLDDVGLASVSVLEVATGDVVAEFRIVGGFVAQQGWEDDSHPLVVVCGDGWRIVRLGLDGTRELAAGPVALAKDPTFKLMALPGNR